MGRGSGNCSTYPARLHGNLSLLHPKSSSSLLSSPSLLFWLNLNSFLLAPAPEPFSLAFSPLLPHSPAPYFPAPLLSWTSSASSASKMTDSPPQLWIGRRYGDWCWSAAGRASSSAEVGEVKLSRVIMCVCVCFSVCRLQYVCPRGRECVSEVKPATRLLLLSWCGCLFWKEYSTLLVA